jgi:glutamate formiminotransferase
MELVECVPNFSEGKREEICREIEEVVRSAGVRILDLEMDKSHNRCVMTFVGEGVQVVEAAFLGARKALELIDLNKHRGEHPRMGACDVIPFVPIKGVSMQDCVLLARVAGKRIGEELGIPVYLYEEAATRPERKNLSEIRKGEFEGLREQIGRDPQKTPDFGPNRIHPTAGAVAVGARMPLVAYNINLDSPDIKIAKRIAKKVRESSGGLPHVKALGMLLEDQGITQVSMNLTNFQVTSIYTVYRAVEEEAKKLGVRIKESEVVGLIPRAAIRQEWIEELKIHSFKRRQIIEEVLGL